MPYNKTTAAAPQLSEFNINGFTVGGVNTASSGSPNGITLTPTYNQSSTAGSADIYISRTETALGSGSHYFLNFLAGSAGTTQEFYVTNAGLCFAQSYAGGTSATAPALASSGTITTAGITNSRVTPASAVTGVIMQPGTVMGQEVTVFNESTTAGNTITMAASGTSNCTGGTGVVIAGNSFRTFVWTGTLWS